MQSNILRNVVVFTKNSKLFGVEYLEALKANNIRPAMIFVENIGLVRKIKMFLFLKKKIGFVDALKYNINFWKNDIYGMATGVSKIDYNKYCDQVIYVDDINNKAVISEIDAYLANNKIDYLKIILAHASLIKSSLLENKNIFILNAHPAKLPDVRGVDVVRWSLFKGVPLGATIHFVNKGVDTGNVIEFKKYSLHGEIDIDTISKNINQLAIDLLVKYTKMDPRPIEHMKQDDRFSLQHYLMPTCLKRQVDSNINKILKEYMV